MNRNCASSTDRTSQIPPVSAEAS